MHSSNVVWQKFVCISQSLIGFVTCVATADGHMASAGNGTRNDERALR